MRQNLHPLSGMDPPLLPIQIIYLCLTKHMCIQAQAALIFLSLQILIFWMFNMLSLGGNIHSIQEKAI